MTHDYDLDLELYGAVDQDSSKISVTARHIVLVIAKKPGAEGFWPRLTLDKSKQPNIKVGGLFDIKRLPEAAMQRLSCKLQTKYPSNALRTSASPPIRHVQSHCCLLPGTSGRDQCLCRRWIGTSG